MYVLYQLKNETYKIYDRLVKIKEKINFPIGK